MTNFAHKIGDMVGYESEDKTERDIGQILSREIYPGDDIVYEVYWMYTNEYLKYYEDEIYDLKDAYKELKGSLDAEM
jgi:hypothetical protein